MTLDNLSIAVAKRYKKTLPLDSLAVFIAAGVGGALICRNDALVEPATSAIGSGQAELAKHFAAAIACAISDSWRARFLRAIWQEWHRVGAVVSHNLQCAGGMLRFGAAG